MGHSCPKTSGKTLSFSQCCLQKEFRIAIRIQRIEVYVCTMRNVISFKGQREQMPERVKSRSR